MLKHLVPRAAPVQVAGALLFLLNSTASLPADPVGFLAVSPSALDFGSVALDQSSSVLTVRLRNPGTITVRLTISSKSPDFPQTNDCGAALYGNSDCTVSVRFQPAGSGVRSSSLLISSSAATLPFSLPLLGTSVLAAAPAPAQLSLSPASLDFGSQPVATRSSVSVVTLSNTGASPFLLSTIGTPNDFPQSNTCGSAVAPNSSCAISVTFAPSSPGLLTGNLTVSGDGGRPPDPLPLRGTGQIVSVSVGGITGIWANEGGDKVSQDELRVSRHVENSTGKVINRAWDGTTIKLSGAQNEVVSFNLVLEAASANVTNVSVQFETLTSPGGGLIASSPATGDGVFNWVGRNIELFYVRYLQITGLSYFGYNKGDERQIPTRFQRPWTGNGSGTGTWNDRPDHGKFYPDIMVPLELVPTFTIQAGHNQSIWSDIYIPKTTPSGLYTGTVRVQENGVTTHSVPVQLAVQNFALPDVPTTKTMVNLDTTDIQWRYVTGFGGYANWNSPVGRTIAQVTDKYFQLFHRHKIALLGENECPIADHPCDSALPRIDGSLYTSAHGYDGPGVNTPTGVYSIGTYGIWGYPQFGIPGWRDNRALFQSHIDNWVNWFDAHSPNTEYFLYLQDEPGLVDYTRVETWSQWIQSDPGPGRRLLSLSTLNAVFAAHYTPTLNVPMTAAAIGTCAGNIAPCNASLQLQSAANFYTNTPGRRFWMYNDGRPATGTFDTEDDGISPRILPWAQYKKNVDRWFYWYANLNSNFDWFTQATTWGSDDFFNNIIGWTSEDGKTNGDGVIVYPGTDLNHPANSYGVKGAFASLRLKEWRRGIQDADYLALANQIDPAKTQQILATVLPKALWEYQNSDPSWYIGPVSWSPDPDDWEAGRAALAQIIAAWCARNSSGSFCAN